MADSPTMLSCGIDGALSGAIDFGAPPSVPIPSRSQPWPIPHDALMRRYKELGLVVYLAPSLLDQTVRHSKEACHLLARSPSCKVDEPSFGPPHQCLEP
jgi:hypothetical protein